MFALPALKLGLAVALGGLTGISLFTFLYAEGYSYLSDRPEACINCHVMQEQYDAWHKSSHSVAAACNDCHTPYDKLGKYFVKATNGLKHSYYFTTGTFHEPIRISKANEPIVEQNCRRCHDSLVDSIHKESEELQCRSCHVRAGHQR